MDQEPPTDPVHAVAHEPETQAEQQQVQHIVEPQGEKQDQVADEAPPVQSQQYEVATSSEAPSQTQPTPVEVALQSGHAEVTPPIPTEAAPQAAQPIQSTQAEPTQSTLVPQPDQIVAPQAQPIVDHAPSTHPEPQQTSQAQQNVSQAPIAAAPTPVPTTAGSSPHLHITPDSERPIDLAEAGFGAKQPTTVMEVFKTTATKYTEQYALSVKRDNTWKHWNWGQYYNDAIQFARALIHIK